MKLKSNNLDKLWVILGVIVMTGLIGLMIKEVGLTSESFRSGVLIGVISFLWIIIVGAYWKKSKRKASPLLVVFLVPFILGPLVAKLFISSNLDLAVMVTISGATMFIFGFVFAIFIKFLSIFHYKSNSK